MVLKIEMLRGFVAVARSGNLTDAAHVLKRTPSAVSMMLKQFESHLGEPLFETDRKNKLTALGTFVLEQSEQELQHFDDTVRAIESFANATLGHVRVAAVPSVAGTLMPRVFSGNIETYDKVRVDLRDMDSRSVVYELTRGRIDLGIATLGAHSSGLDSRLLMKDRFGVLCSKDHPLAQNTAPVQWEALEGERLITNSLSESIDSDASIALHASSRLAAQNLTSMLGMVRANLGITILPEMAAYSAGASDFAFRRLADTSATRSIHLLRRSDSELSPAARMLEADILEAATTLLEGPEL